MRPLLWMLSIGLVLGACSEPDVGAMKAEDPGAAAPRRGKRAAPVTIRPLRLDERDASLVVEFDRDAVDVTIRAYGVDGLSVLREDDLVRGGAYRKGETATFDVPLDPASAPGILAVRVEGTFEGRPGFRVSTFDVGGPARVVQSPSADVVESEGQRLRVTRAKERVR